MSYQEDREKRISIFEDTLQFCEREHKLVKAVENSRENTILYREPLSEVAKPRKRWDKPCEVIVTQYRILEAVQKWYTEFPQNRIGVLNFASATIPGGDVTRGGETQEECLCRCTTLYPCLNVDPLWKGYYLFHRQRHSALYTNACIYIPGIVGIKTDERWPELKPEKDWSVADIISCSMPDLREHPSRSINLLENKEIGMNNEELIVFFHKRIMGFLQVAASHEIDILVLGAFCDSRFRNSSHMEVAILKNALKEFAYSFKAVEFAVGYTSGCK